MFRGYPLLLVLLAWLIPLAAHTAPLTPTGSLVEMQVVDRDTGQWLPSYPHRGATWVAGQPGHRYAIQLTNHSNARVLVVLSVDGINVINGQTADPLQDGYVLNPGQSTEIAGWRKSMDEIAQFVFTQHRNSYASRTGRPDNVGVIGIAVFRQARPRLRTYSERVPELPGLQPPPEENPMFSTEKSMQDVAPSANTAQARQRIGTGHGQRELAPVRSTHFIRASTRPDQISQIRYDEPRRLAAMGILPPPDYRPAYREPVPHAFPNHFVPDPPAR